MSTNFNIIDLLKRKRERQPWDERLPSGETPVDLLRRPPQPPNAHWDATGQNPDGGEWISGPNRHAGSSPAIQRAALGVSDGDIVELLKRQPQPTGLPDPPNEGPASTQISRVRVGTDTRGLDPTARQQAKVDLLRQAPASSRVRDTGDFIEEGPPEQSPSRVKNALLGLLLGTAQGGLPGGIALAAGGAIKPEMIQELLKQKRVAREEGQLERQVGIDAKRAGVEHTRAQTDAMKQGQRRYVERSDGVYEISPLFPEGRKLGDIPAEVRAAAQGSVHYEPREDGLYAVMNEGGQLRAVKVPGVPGKPASAADNGVADEGEAIATSTQAAANELKATLDQQKAQLTTNEKSIREKEAAWRTEAQRLFSELHKKVEDKADDGSVMMIDKHSDDKRTVKDFVEEARAADVDYQKGTYDETVENTKRLKDAIDEGGKRHETMLREIREGKAKTARGSGRGVSSQQSYAGRTMSAANLTRYAKDKGISEEEARRQVEAQGVRVQ